MTISTIERLNPFIPEVIEDPYKFYRRYRELDPVHWGLSANPRLSGSWYLFRYEDVVHVLESPKFGREAARVREDGKGAPVPAAYKGFRSMVSNWMVFRDPPDHTRLRSLVNKVFSPRMVENIRPAIFGIADSLLDRVQNRGAMDLVEDFAFPLPVMVIATLLGVDPQDRPMFREWALALQHASASRLTPSPEVYAQAEQATWGFIEYFKIAIAQRHLEPRQDLITALVKAQDEGNKLNDEEILATCIHLLTAGHETTINLIAKGMLALLRNPDALKLLRSHPELIAGAVEELIRYDSPVQMVTRWAFADVEIGGKVIQRGDSVGLVLGSANRDPARFVNPDVLDIQRQDCKHCGFGSGIHFCLGAALARAEAAIALNVLLNRLPEVRLLNEKVEWANNIVFHGPKHLRVGFRKVMAIA
ncbi:MULTISPECIES: cytochrome P450 [Fischerella]|uniref:cytochrome P450 n=1 Tax=Fischerella TaxID=1190 RepID=UPI000303D153|nr:MULTISPECIES: cytochrome P450 [Fischerella]MBD2434540.1 cytochrome P450 [Fischerella sp. FACHB-380]